MSKCIIQNCPCIEPYNKLNCISSNLSCDKIKVCTIKSIIKTCLLVKCSCLACVADCYECTMAEAIKMANDIVKRLNPKIIEEKDSGN